MSRRSWTRDVVTDTLFDHDGHVAKITGLRKVLIHRIEPGVRSVVDVMTNSGARVAVDVIHGVGIGSNVSSMAEEVANSRAMRNPLEGDPDFEAIMEIVVRLMTCNGKTIDVITPVEPRAFMRKLIAAHVQAAWRGLNNRGVEFEDALEGARRFFS